MSRILGIITAIWLGMLSWDVAAQEPSALAQLGPDGARVFDDGGVVVLEVPLTQPVPWRVELANDPPRVLVEFGDVVWSSLPDLLSESIAETKVDTVRAGWSELSLILREPLEVETAEMVSAEDGSAVLTVTLVPSIGDVFREQAGTEDPAAKPVLASDKLVVAIDPGHGGVDPGAVSGDLVEADLMLAFARALKETLLRTDLFDVVLTREEDVFVSLNERMSVARAAGADVFLSLHADALKSVDGSASGMTVYRLPDNAGPEADADLTERHPGDDLLQGADLTDVGDDVALALLELARRDTTPRSHMLQEMLVEAFVSSEMPINSRPARQAVYAVLKAADVPSVLIELGFLSSSEDRARLATVAFREQAAVAITEALLRWHDEDRLWQEAVSE